MPYETMPFHPFHYSDPYRMIQLTLKWLRRVPRSSYYDRNFRQGPALIRARKPYLMKNALTGLGLWCVVGGVCKNDLGRLPSTTADIMVRLVDDQGSWTG